MFRIENVVGKLVEIHVTDLRSMEEMNQFSSQVIETVKAVPGRVVAVVDLRLPRVFAPDVAEALEEMLRRANPKIERSAILLAPSHAILTMQLERLIREVNPQADVVVASNPEFLREGAAIRDFKFPDRIVVGTSDERAQKATGALFILLIDRRQILHQSSTWINDGQLAEQRQTRATGRSQRYPNPQIAFVYVEQLRRKLFLIALRL